MQIKIAGVNFSREEIDEVLSLAARGALEKCGTCPDGMKFSVDICSDMFNSVRFASVTAYFEEDIPPVAPSGRVVDKAPG